MQKEEKVNCNGCHHNACDCREAAMKKLVDDMLNELRCFGGVANSYEKRIKELFGELR
jgi:hypothetical protein